MNTACFPARFAVLSALWASVLGAQAPVASGTLVPAVSGARIAAQLSAGLVGGMAGFVGGGLTARWIARSRRADDDRASRVAYAGALAGAVLMTAAGPALLGSPGGIHGSYPGAVGGAVGGGALSMLIRHIGRSGVLGDRGPVAIVTAAAIFALPSVGAIVAYNGSRRR